MCNNLSSFYCNNREMNYASMKFLLIQSNECSLNTQHLQVSELGTQTTIEMSKIQSTRGYSQHQRHHTREQISKLTVIECHVRSSGEAQELSHRQAGNRDGPWRWYIVSQGCHPSTVQSGQVKKQKIICSQCQSLIVQDQLFIILIASEAFHFGQIVTLFLCPHMAAPYSVGLCLCCDLFL